MVHRSRRPEALAVARVDRQLPAYGADGHRACGSVRRTAFTDLRSSKGIEAGDAYVTQAPDIEDDDPSDVLRRVQAGMSAARLSVPLDEQVEVVGEQFYPKQSASWPPVCLCRQYRYSAPGLAMML